MLRVPTNTMRRVVFGIAAVLMLAGCEPLHGGTGADATGPAQATVTPSGSVPDECTRPGAGKNGGPIAAHLVTVPDCVLVYLGFVTKEPTASDLADDRSLQADAEQTALARASPFYPHVKVRSSVLARVALPHNNRPEMLVWMVDLTPDGGYQGVGMPAHGNYLIALVDAKTGDWITTQGG